MKRILVTLAIVALAPVVVVPAAEAGNFSIGLAFDVGGLLFDLGFGGPRYSAHARHHVYRVRETLHTRGYQCHSGCYRSGGYGYHHADCPAVAYYFRSHGFSPYASYPSYFAPRADGHYTGHYTGRYGSHSFSHGGYYRHYNRSTYGGRHGSRYDDHRYDRTRERSHYGARDYRHHRDNRRDHDRDHRSRHDYRDGRDRRHHDGHGGRYREHRIDRHGDDHRR